ncbi:E3 Ubiquitin ligase [Clostridium collagenovorans DSM 3089]|uniref:RING-type E3 ubiquitin transferase n=1 Tax=Clostridium collagenovorans DSM 3089 TaxID=1121306 RepID=A0A1M5UZU1_9CLOT|nr:GIDE domain-containing protein [Clostridium collagenovorans]SHH68511.1 E3 Ubiquitin ligase [Clostridium collagenovorans DSM 3089]
MNVLIFILVIIACVGYVIYVFKQADSKSLDISYMKTSSLSDAISVLDEMSNSDTNYRHYAEIKVTAHGNNSFPAPFSGQSVIYYSNQCFSVTQEKQVTYDKENKRHERIVKRESELSSDNSSEPIFIKDNSIESPILLDLQSFGSKSDLTAGCDRFENKDSQFSRSHFSNYRSGADFLGFRLKERILREGQPLYILGELYRMGNDLYFGYAHQANKSSMVSVKSEDQILNDVKGEKTKALITAAGVAIVAFFFFFSKQF